MADKPFLNYADQISKLKQKNLSFVNEAVAISALKGASYFALVNGYKDLFKNRTTGNYKDGIFFEDLVCLYIFDEQLRNLLIRNILFIERRIKSLLSYSFCEKFGDDQRQYLSTSNYQYDPTDNRISSDVAELIFTLSRVTSCTQYPYIKHCTNKHQNVPLWVLINALTFGKVSKFFALCLPSVQQKICTEYVAISPKQMTSALKVLTKFRNVCAHNERLYNYKTKDALPKMKIHDALHLPLEKSGREYKNGTKDLFAVVIIFKCLLSDDEFTDFFSQLNALISNFSLYSDIVDKDDILNQMGFPSNWKDIKTISNKA